MENLTDLRVLDLSENQITEIKGLDSLKNLEFLSLYSNKIIELKGLENLIELKDLHIGGNRISNIENLDNLKNLITLDLSPNEITEIKNLEKLESLRILFLSENQIKEINGLDSLTNLKQLELDDNKLDEIKGLDHLKNLETLSLCGNNITEIKELKNCQNLKSLALEKNEILEIKDLKNFEELEDLWLDENKISKIENLENLKNLRALGLSENKIEEITGLDNLESLELLLLSNNQIQEIKGLDKLLNLEHLELENNVIKEIKGLSKLKKLKFLFLDENNITELEGLEDLDNLEVLKINNNEFKGLDEYIIRSGTSIEGIKNYCKKKKLRKLPQLEFYEEEKTYDDNLQKFAQLLKEIDEKEFIKVGTYEEDKSIKKMQNLFFYDQPLTIVDLSKKDLNLSNIRINLIQIHSLKGINYPKDDKIKFFLFYLSQFWDKTIIDNDGCLIYNELEDRASQKIDEMLELSITIEDKKPNLIVFPENTIPYNKIEDLVEFSKNNNLVIVGGLEHQTLENNDYFINKAIIIDRGLHDFQVKQTPVEIKSKKLQNPILEKILCQKIPEFKIFQTSIGRVAIFICRDFLRMNKIISEWVYRNKVDFIIIPSLTSKILPFHSKLLNIFNQRVYPHMKLIFTNVGEYGGSEMFSINHVKRIEENFRINNRDNVGETIVVREMYEEIKEDFYGLVGKFLTNFARLENSIRQFIFDYFPDQKIKHRTFYDSIRFLNKIGILKTEFHNLEILRNFRNKLVHVGFKPLESELK